MMKVIFDEEAREDLQGIFDWIARDNPQAARRVVFRILRRIELLENPGFSRIGRIGREPGTHELIERPYIIVYEVREQRQEIVILAVVHGARHRP